METLLQSWSMPEEVVQAFIKNNIKESHLEHITDDQLKELCPILGLRIDLRKNIADYLLSKAPTETNTTETTKDFDMTVIDGDLSFSLTDIFTSRPTLRPTFQDFDLNTLLATSPCGKSVLDYYCVNGCLDTKRRNRLTDIIVRHLFTFIINHRLTHEDYNIITGKIITVFPKESAATYFTNPIRKSNSYKGKSIAARGKLIDKVRNILFESGERKRKHVDSNDETSSLNSSSILPGSLRGPLLESLKEDIEWLRMNDDPWSEVVERWKKTSEARHNEQYDGNIENFISQWSILNSPKAVELIEEDFYFLYPLKANNFSKNWHNFFGNLINIKVTDLNKDIYKENLATSLNFIDNEDHKIPTQVTLLTHLIPPKGRHNKKEKFSIQECLESIMLIVENPGDISRTVEEQKKKALKKKLPVQPYLILLGSLQNVRQLYLVVDKIRYTFDSIPKAFDILFKCYHVFSAKYPKASDHILLIIQRCVYEITTKYDNAVPYIADVLKLAE